MENVVYLADRADVDLTPEQVLERASATNLSGLLVIGTTQDGVIYFDTSIPDGSECNWLIDKVKHLILAQSFEGLASSGAAE